MIQLLILANVLVFVGEVFSADALLSVFALWPPTLSANNSGGVFVPWQLMTYAFLHANAAHLVFNMLGLYVFGREVEGVLGTRRLSFLYFSSIVSAALAQIVCAAVGLQPAGPVIGASGGLFGLLLAYAVLFPNRRVVPLFPPIPMPAWLFATVYGGVEFVFGVSGIESGVAHFAHLGGMAGSGLLLWAWLHAAPRESSS
ncbi:rhomboid family intramembrane serine protease [Ralstonia mannitolilytica]|uniref:rhomboid family intramembrane serine protease n=1 Tax=Ralstonia mannitolilytica TaxID=105219 RepID=UPI000CEDC078|nr:rhomboid family intramembrane serine protease [Ralstonia mannitolilytica]CAJ0705401.1 hypothetical protein LMG18102_04464 [Ralstonia mannitolilytica]